MFKFSDQTADKTGKGFYHLANQLYPFAQSRLGFDKPASCVLVSDPENAQNPLGYTAHYNPDKSEIVVYSDGRHIKDMLRSFTHELVHHAQACRGDLHGASTEEGYAQKDQHMREMEREAYEQGNLIFRDWEDDYKSRLKEWKNVTDLTSKKYDPKVDKYHSLNVLSHNDVYDQKTQPYFNKFEENYQPSPISDEFKQDIISQLDLENPEETKKLWIGTADWGEGEVSYFWVQRNKLFYLVEFSPTYGVDIKNVFSTWYQVNNAGLRNLYRFSKGAEVTTFQDKRR